MSKLLTVFLACVLFCQILHGQCTSAIAGFPYTEDFEATNGGWLPGGTASQWSWGTPAKPVISSAASGQRCWITGTLTQSAYSNNQNSTLTSPCWWRQALLFPFFLFPIGNTLISMKCCFIRKPLAKSLNSKVPAAAFWAWWEQGPCKI